MGCRVVGPGRARGSEGSCGIAFHCRAPLRCAAHYLPACLPACQLLDGFPTHLVLCRFLLHVLRQLLRRLRCRLGARRAHAVRLLDGAVAAGVAPAEEAQGAGEGEGRRVSEGRRAACMHQGHGTRHVRAWSRLASKPRVPARPLCPGCPASPPPHQAPATPPAPPCAPPPPPAPRPTHHCPSCHQEPHTEVWLLMYWSSSYRDLAFTSCPRSSRLEASYSAYASVAWGRGQTATGGEAGWGVRQGRCSWGQG